MNNKKILFIGNDHYYIGVIRGYCEAEGCTMMELFDTDNIDQTINRSLPDIIVLDSRTNNQMIAMVKKAIATHAVPLIAIGEPEEGTIIESSNVIKHPVDPKELIFCLRRMLNLRMGYERRHLSRRSKNDRRGKPDRRSQEVHDLSFTNEFENILGTAIPADEENDSIQIDDRSKELLINGVAIHLSPKELNLIKFLAQKPGQVFSCKEILDALWRGDQKADESDVRQYIYLLRSKIECDPKNPQIIISVQGFGYKYCVIKPRIN